MSKLRTLSLFSGTAMIEYGLEQSGGFETVGFCEHDKHCQAILRKNYPGVPIYDDVKTLDGRPLKGKVDVISGGYPCFPAGTLVTAKHGYIAIEDVKPGDEVMTHLGRFRKVVQTFPQPAKRLHELKIQGTKLHRVTEEHPYLARKARRVWNNPTRSYSWKYEPAQWIAAKDLTTDHMVHLPVTKTIECPSDITVEEAWLMGRYAADGYCQTGLRAGRKNSYNKKVIFCVGKHKADEFERKLITYSATKSPSRTTIKYVMSGDRILGLAKSCGRGAENKCIPKEILYGDLTLSRAFYEGYISGDGSISGNKVKATSVSEVLMLQLQYLVAKVQNVFAGYRASTPPKTTVIEGRTVNQRPAFHLEFRAVSHKQAQWASIDGEIWMPVTSNTLTDQVEPVYNFEVEEDNTYVVHNVAVHNCTGHSVAGKKRGHADEQSGLWSHYKRLAQEIEPTWIIIENSANLRTTGLVRVLQDLWALGYRDIRWDVLPSSAYGTIHRRERIWIVANRNGIRLSEASFAPAQKESVRRASAWADFSNRRCPEPKFYGVDDADAARLDEARRKQRVKQCGNAVNWRIAECIGREIMRISK